jgi:hypothetical protein
MFHSIILIILQNLQDMLWMIFTSVLLLLFYYKPKIMIQINSMLDYIEKNIISINRLNLFNKKLVHIKLEEYNIIIKYSIMQVIILSLIIYLYYYLKSRGKDFSRFYYDLFRMLFIIPYSIFLIIYVFEIYSFNFWEIIYQELDALV